MGYRTKDFEIVMIYKPDRDSMLNALRIVLEIQKARNDNKKMKVNIESTNRSIIR